MTTVRGGWEKDSQWFQIRWNNKICSKFIIHTWHTMILMLKCMQIKTSTKDICKMYVVIYLPKKSTSTRDPAPLCALQSADIWFLRHIQHTLVIQLFVMGSTPAPPLSRKTVNGVLEISFTDIGWYFWIVMAIRSKWLSVCPWIYRWSWKSLNHTRMAGHQRHGWRFWHTKPLSKSHKELGHGLSALASCEM